MNAVLCWLLHRKWRVCFEREDDGWGWTEFWGCFACCRSWEKRYDAWETSSPI